jgi:hypothetical protein
LAYETLTTLTKGVQMYIVYSSTNEIIVTTPEHEPEMLKDYFGIDMGRDPNDYDRDLRNDTAIHFSSSIKLE